MQRARDRIIALWLHIWLKRIAKRFPDFFEQILSEIIDSDKGRKIMRARYIQRLKFKEIPEIVHLEERQIYKIHQQIIDKLINL